MPSHSVTISHLSVPALPTSAALFFDPPSAWLSNTFPVLSAAESCLSSSASRVLSALVQCAPFSTDNSSGDFANAFSTTHYLALKITTLTTVIS